MSTPAAQPVAPQPTWTGRVVCGHRAVLGRQATVASWDSDDDCTAAEVGGWQIGVAAATPADAAAVLAAVAAAREGGAPGGAPEPVASILVRVATRGALPECSILLADGDQVAALAWGRPLGVVELGGWEYAVTSSPPGPDMSWAPLATGTLAALDPCGPTRFSLGTAAVPTEEFW